MDIEVRTVKLTRKVLEQMPLRHYVSTDEANIAEFACYIHHNHVNALIIRIGDTWYTMNAWTIAKYDDQTACYALTRPNGERVTISQAYLV